MYSIFLISILLPMMGICIFAPYYYNRMYENSNNNSVKNTLSSLSASMEIYISELVSISQTPYLYSNVLDHMRNLNVDGAIYQNNLLMANQLENDYCILFAKQMYNSPQNIRQITFYPNNRRDVSYVLSKNNAEILKTDASGSEDSQWYREASKLDGDVLFYPFLAQDASRPDQLMFSLVRIIKDFDSRKNIGILKIDVSSESFIELLEGVIISPDTGLLLTGGDGEILYRNTANEDILKADRAGDLESTAFPHFSISRFPIDDSRLSLVYLRSRNEMLLHSLVLYSVTFLISLALVGISSFIYHLQSRKMILSINGILDALQKIENGNLDIHISDSSNQELMEISQAVNHMALKLQEHITKEYKAALSQRNAEYMALQSQINPHFLYNTLNGFIALNRMGERQLLEKSIFGLTRLFQYTCSQESISTVGLELQFIRQYMELQSLKYDERLNYDITTSPEAEMVPLPKLLIQPLIENSILHGMEPTQMPIHISLYAGIHRIPLLDQCLIIYVKDDGVGFDPSGEHKASKRIGLGNIQQRIQYYKEQSLFHISSKPGAGTSVLILIKI